MASGTLIDIHSHIYPEWYLDELRLRTQVPYIKTGGDGDRLVVIPETEGVPLTPAYWSVDEKLRFMDGVGIAVSLVSAGNPWLGFLDDSVRSPEWANRINLDLSTWSESSPHRLFALGVLPTSSIVHCVQATQAVSQRPSLKGFITGTDICGLGFDEPELDQLWEALDKAGCIVLVHPGAEWLRSARDSLGLTVGVSFPLETTIAASRLLLARVPERFPKIRFLLAHGGGTLPFILGRLDHVWRHSSPPSELARSFYADALVYSERTMEFVADRLGEGRLMWGSDHPFSMPDAPGVSVPADVRAGTARALLDL